MRDRHGERVSEQSPSIWRRGGTLMACIGLLAASGCSVYANTQLSGARYRSDVSTVQMVSAVIGGKNVFVPSTVVVSDAMPQILSIYNATDNPHGFAIAGLGIQAVLPATDEIQIELPELPGGQIYRINCHLHPPHLSANLVVVRGE